MAEDDTNLMKRILDQKRKADAIRQQIRASNRGGFTGSYVLHRVGTRPEKQARAEVEVSRQFGTAIGAPQIDMTSIESKSPPEPDILCVVDSNPRYFELQRITTLT